LDAHAAAKQYEVVACQQRSFSPMQNSPSKTGGCHASNISHYTTSNNHLLWMSISMIPHFLSRWLFAWLRQHAKAMPSNLPTGQ
jgi:hypothetical protein